MFLDAFGFIIDAFIDVITWFLNYPIQSGVTFGGILLVTVIISALFVAVSSIFEFSGLVNNAADRAQPHVRRTVIKAKRQYHRIKRGDK